MTPPIRAVLFDLDGTLLDSIQLILDSYRHAFVANNLPPRPDHEWLAGIGTSLRIQLSPWASDPSLHEALIASYRDYNISNHDARVRAYPGAVEMVTDVRSRGLATALVTSKQRAGAMRGLRLLGLEAAFQVVVAADDVVNPKPDPEPVVKAAGTLGVRSDECLFVGDSIHDLRAGRAARARTVACLWGPFPRADLESGAPDFWIDAPVELAAVIERAAA